MITAAMPSAVPLQRAEAAGAVLAHARGERGGGAEVRGREMQLQSRQA